ncbi:porin [Pandoraea terrae]|nr:porin [Pandoraea terrae]
MSRGQMKYTSFNLAARALLVLAALGNAGASLAASAASGKSSPATVKKLEAKVDDLSQQLAELRQQLQDMKQQNATLATQQQQTAQQTQQTVVTQQQLQTEVAAATQAAQQAQAKISPWENVSLWGYGEIYYARPTRRSDLTRADLARAVFGIGYQFDDKTRFNSEFEIEHAITSASDVGEFEVEQFYVDHKFNDKISAKAGLFLIPAGLLNENHEPTNFYGVQRNFVETLIIPSTWREGGVQLYGDTDFGLGWNVGLTTGLDLSKWNFSPTSPQYQSALELINNSVAPMQATHQELAGANAQKLSQFVALNYRGLPGLTVGGSYFTGGVVRSIPDVPNNERVNLWETHVRYQPGKWDFSALYAHGSFTHTAEANALNPGATNPLPASFYGWYAQAAYNLWQSGEYRVAPFLRYERYNMAASYEGIAAGASTTPDGFPSPRDTVVTIGANFYLNPKVVFKIDYQRFKVNRDFSRIDLGLGLQF